MSAGERPYRVLFIDDDVYMLELISMVLESEGFDVVLAANGQEGKAAMLDRAQQPPFDVIMVDLMMPVMDGLRFLRWLRKDAESRIPVLVLTGRFGTDTVEAVKQAGADALLFKPIDASKIVAQLRLLLLPRAAPALPPQR